MKSYALLASIAAVGGVAVFGNPPVELQSITPGTLQNGNLNISGTAKAGTVVAYSSEPTGIVYGGDFRSVSTQGRGVLGNASSPTGVTYGGLFQSASSTGRGVAGISSATTGFAVGGFFTTNSPDGKGVQGSSNATNGLNFGVYGRNLSDAGFGVYSEGHAGITGNLGIGLGTDVPYTRLKIKDDDEDGAEATVLVTNGTHTIFGVGRGAIHGEARGSNFCIGLSGYAHSTTGGGSYGVFSEAKGTNGINYGVYGRASQGTTNYAGFFAGLLYANSASSGVKAFTIDHPMDPANKVLNHSSVESDERLNLYRGEVITDKNGRATITLPNYFDALNEEALYQLTVVANEESDFVMAQVSQRLKNGKFKIRTSAPNTTVSWQVSGRRHDPTSNYYPLEVERNKTKDEKGKYFVPEAYGKDPSLAIGNPTAETMGAKPPKR